MALKKLRCLVLMHEDLLPPEQATVAGRYGAPWRTEYDVVTTLKKIGHEVLPCGVRSDLGVVRKAIEEFKPHIAFNLLEEFDGQAVYDQNIVGFLELLRMPYTGCNPRGLMLSRDKALCKKILSYHRIQSPEFAVFPVGRRVKRPKRLAFPLIVKSLVEEASLGISQASVVYDDAALDERVRFIHERIGTDALVEEFIDGRELTVSVIGNSRLVVFPIWELVFKNMPENSERIATARVKWNAKYQKKCGIDTREARDVPEAAAKKLTALTKRIYKILGLNGAARIDYRMKENGEIYVLEANPNPQVAYGEDFATAAKKSGIEYNDLLQRLLNLGLHWAANRSG